jgi:predicted lysophospholipase L1 biosynthesis ABC-type transport system permease subunit
LFPEEPDPVNRVLIVNGQDFRIAGIVADVRHSSLEEQAGNEMYILATQQPGWWGAVGLVVRSPLPPELLAGGVRAAIRSVDPDLPASDSQTLQDIVDRAVSPRRFILLIIQGFAVTALLLASLGIYGVLSYSVSQRTREMGIRMALGASRRRLQAQVVARTLVMASIGVVIGWLGALALSRVMGSLLYGVGTTDPLTYAGVTVLLIAIAALAGYVPARRAAHVDPMKVLTA